MSNGLRLVVDGEMSEDHLVEIRAVLDINAIPKISKVELDFDSISDERMMELVNAMHQSSLTRFKLGLSTVNEKLAQSLFEVCEYNKRIETCWLLLGQHYFYYRDNDMGEVNSVIHLGYAKRVTIDCQSMTALQVDQLIATVNKCEITQDLNIKIANLDPDAAFALVDALNANQKLTKLSLNINGEVSGFDRTIDNEVVELFSTFMVSAQQKVSAASEFATNHASDLLDKGKAILSAFTAPLTACTNPTVPEDALIPPNVAPPGKLKFL